LLGMEDVVRISSLRQDIRSGFGVAKLSVDVLRRTFGLESPSGLSPPATQSVKAEEVESSCSPIEVPKECTITWDGLVEFGVQEVQECAEEPPRATPMPCAQESADEFEPTAVVPKTEPWNSWTSTVSSPSGFGASSPNFLGASSGSGSKSKTTKKGRR